MPGYVKEIVYIIYSIFIFTILKTVWDNKVMLYVVAVKKKNSTKVLKKGRGITVLAIEPHLQLGKNNEIISSTLIANGQILDVENCKFYGDFKFQRQTAYMWMRKRKVVAMVSRSRSNIYKAMVEDFKNDFKYSIIYVGGVLICYLLIR